MKAYAVRHKPSGLFIPRLATGKCRGGSHLEPSNDREPRLFFSRLSASSFLGQWLIGIQERHFDHEGQEDIRITAQPHRKKDEMEIVEFLLLEQKA